MNTVRDTLGDTLSLTVFWDDEPWSDGQVTRELEHGVDYTEFAQVSIKESDGLIYVTESWAVWESETHATIHAEVRAIFRWADVPHEGSPWPPGRWSLAQNQFHADAWDENGRAVHLIVGPATKSNEETEANLRKIFGSRAE